MSVFWILLVLIIWLILIIGMPMLFARLDHQHRQEIAANIRARGPIRGDIVLRPKQIEMTTCPNCGTHFGTLEEKHAD